MVDLEKLLSCPRCAGPLVFRKALTCRDCRREYPVTNDVPEFIPYDPAREKNTGEQCARAIEEAARSGWQQALLDVFGPVRSRYYSFLERGTGTILTAINENSVVLDAGCGMGPFSFFVARFCMRVYALDVARKPLEFIRTRAEQDGVSNITPVLSDARNIPLPKASCDLIILNGVLEWLPDSYREGAPFRVQTDTLTHLGSYLKPGGEVYVGIENRFGLRYLLGAREDHSNLRWIGVMPRWSADLYSHLARGKGFRTHTQSLWGLQRMFRNAGLRLRQLYLPVEDYRDFRYLMDLKFPNRLRFFERTFLASVYRPELRHKLYRMLLRCVLALRLDRLKVLQYVANSFVLIARKEP